MIPTDKVGEPDDDQTQDGGEDAEPLAGRQLASQERHGEQASEYDDGSAQHLEAGGAGHIESWKSQIERPVDQGRVAKKTRISFSDYHLFPNKRSLEGGDY